jgi:hypothetical protein
MARSSVPRASRRNPAVAKSARGKAVAGVGATPVFIDVTTGSAMKIARAPAPCPFCGDPSNPVSVERTADRLWFATAPCCAARGPLCTSVREAARSWNGRRTADAWRLEYAEEKLKRLEAGLSGVRS